MAANYVLLEKITVGAAGAASVTFNSIPQTGYTDLVVKVSGRSARSAQQADNLFITFNSNTTGYTMKALAGNGTSPSSTGYSSRYASFAIDAAGSTASTFSNHEIYIPNYASANNKSFSVDSVSENNATDAQSDLVAGLWSNTAAITSIGLQPEVSTWVANSTFYLYGVAKLGTTPAIVPYATGGDTIMTDGTYWYHAFLSSGTFTPQKGLSCDVLSVAGGGSGGGTTCCSVWVGGGGAGGVYYTTTSVSTAQTVTVGAGGAAPTAGGHPNGNPGSNSVFGSLTAAVGGGYGGGIQELGGNGGSGGGGGGYTTGQAGGTATSGQGFNGGSGGGGGGGGAGAVGANGTNSVNGVAGGSGINTYSSWLSATGLGVSGFIAGGGGGSASITGIAGAGGAGGGGAGGLYQANGTAATINTGSGGGAGGQSQGPNTVGGAGGSGLVIVRYLV
jgi:hypothetical protein